jgi:RNA polymerase sigma factor (TIGR02999 family)
MCDVTRILGKIEAGDPTAAEQLLPLVYDELRKLAAAKMAQEKPDQTLQATALVHEAYIRLVDVDIAQHWDSRRHFFAAAAEAMRRILVDGVRRKQRLKRGGDFERVDLDGLEITVEGPDRDIVALDEALGRLAERHPVEAELVKLRFFAGMTLQEASQTLGLSSATGDRKWAYAKAWLYREVTPASEL